MVVRCNSFGLYGMDSYPVVVEASVLRGAESFEIVGLPDAAVKESRDRVRNAVINCGFKFPRMHLTINLAPADTKKGGSVYDLPIFISIVKVMGNLIIDTDDCAFIGELSLSGDVRPVNGVLAMAIKAKEIGIKRLFVPYENGDEASVVEGVDVYPVKNVNDLLSHFKGICEIPLCKNDGNNDIKKMPVPDFSQVRGQNGAKRALEIAAAGGHNILMIGPPGSGKSMLAKRVPGILPDMTDDEKIETTKIHSIAGILPRGSSLVDVRPFRSPHHSVSPVALSGGGTVVKPGEVSLASNGVLFLDEFTEFGRQTMEILRQPLEDGVITVSRANGKYTYPCKIMLIAAMNPCPCGYLNHPTRKCTCSEERIQKYLNKISGPIIDRMDIHIEVPPVDYDELTSESVEESSQSVKERVNRARNIQSQRFKNSKTTCNARMSDEEFETYCKVSADASELLKNTFEAMGLSARAYNRILKVARTIADLEGNEEISASDVAEAIQYRTLDRKYWNR